ncbi:MAG: RHS repeat-associated core domain-containing protein [Spirosomataceae bacterium]
MAQRKDAYNNKVYEIETRGLYAQTYTYDNLNRLKTANLDKNGSGVLAMTGSQSGIAYDANGNILSMQRTFKGQLVDDLTYNLPTTGNRLTSVQDNGNDTFVKSGTNSYTYDANGNLLTDSGKGVSNITYNYLNLPQQINTANGTLVYSYTATGQKLRMTVPPSGAEGAKTYDYVGSLVYENNVLAFIGTTEGRVLPPDKAVNPKPLPLTTVLQKNTFYRYEYQLKDHLGNLRLACRCAEKAFKTSPADTYPLIAVQENHYDAWGLSLPLVETTDKLSGSPEHRWQYNGKEKIADLGWLDYGARMYMPEIGRWGVIDPMAEASEDFSPYQYAENNPILNIDFLGLTDVKGDGADDSIVLPEVVVKGKRNNDNESTLNNIQTTLDVAGWVPGIQTVAGLTNAGIDIYRGNYGSALMNLGSSIPIAGYLFKGAKVAAMTTKVVSSIAKMKVVKAALAITYHNMKSITGYAKHHIIPQATLKEFGEKFAEAGLNIHMGDNIRYLKNGFHTKHNAYTEVVSEKFRSIIAENGKLTMGDINGVINDMHKIIDQAEQSYKTTGTTLNKFIKENF